MNGWQSDGNRFFGKRGNRSKLNVGKAMSDTFVIMKKERTKKQVDRAIRVQLLDEYDTHQLMEIAISILLDDHDWDKSDLMEWILDHQ